MRAHSKVIWNNSKTLKDFYAQIDAFVEKQLKA
jgi:hypothetical protein